MKSPLSHILLLWQAIRMSSVFPNSAPPELGLPVHVIIPSTQPLAPTPPMGFNNWARYECKLDEKLFTDTADWMVAHGLLAAGYDTITVDDCWMTMDRDPLTNALVVNSTLFPQGMAWLGQYFHRRGFKFGIYEDAGHKTCGGYPGSQGYFHQDVAQFASWEVDYIKLDGCYVYRNESLPESETLEPTFRQLYEGFGDAIRSQVRPMVYSESAPAYFAGLSAGTGDRVGRDWYKVMTWIGRYGQLWRHSTDISVYKKDGESRWPSVMTNYRFNIRLARFQRPGNWNDPDFIITGDDEGLTIEEQKSQFALWTIMASPLILSTNVKELTFEQIAYLTNKEIIGINQDPLGIQGRIAWRTELSDVLVKPLQDPTVRAAAVLNKQRAIANVTVPFSRLGYTFLPTNEGCEFLVRELFSQSEEKVTVYNPRKESITSLLRPHATALFKFTSLSNSPSCRPSVPTGSIYLASSLLCLDVFNSETAPGTPTLAFPCTIYDNQLWQTSSVPPPFTTSTTSTTNGQSVFSDPKTLLWIKTLDNLCLDTDFSVPTPVPGSRVVVNPCNVTRETQQWTYDPMQGTLFHAYSGFCVDAPGATNVASLSESLIALRLWKCGDQKDSQVWSMPV